jgi:hypothetical protein
MFSPTQKGIIWDSADAHSLQSFLETPVGSKVLHILHSYIPALLDGEHKNQTLVRSGEVKGAQTIFDMLVSLTVEPPVDFRPQPKNITENYADLDDESKWDGENPR